HPIKQRLFHAFFFGNIGKTRAIVIDAIRYNGPPVIFSFLDDVDFITTLWAMFMFPNFACNGMYHHALRISVAIAVNRFFGIGFVYKWIIFRYSAIVIKAVYFTVIPCDVLGVGIAVATLTGRKI